MILMDNTLVDGFIMKEKNINNQEQYFSVLDFLIQALIAYCSFL